MKTYKENEIIKIEKTLETVHCDLCYKPIKSKEETDDKNNHKSYVNVCTSHSDWGNDSCESYEYFDICSNECAIKFLENFIKDKSNTKKIEMEWDFV